MNPLVVEMISGPQTTVVNVLFHSTITLFLWPQKNIKQKNLIVIFWLLMAQHNFFEVIICSAAVEKKKKKKT